jgi:hypothetical protein
MLAAAFHDGIHPATERITFAHAFLVAWGGAFVGYGFAFPLKYPPHQMILGMVGMFAAQAWESGNSVGLLIYVGLTVLFFGIAKLGSARSKAGGKTKD